MVRGRLAAFLPTVLLACIQISGCGGGGTSRLAVVTTTLPSGTVGTPYTQTLTATGGTPPYVWSQTSGGAMPGGVSLNNTGTFFGTPTTAGTFGPYVFTVTDSTGATALSASLSIMINSTGLSVTTTSLPTGTVGSPYSATLAAIGGTPPYTWAQTSGGAFPPGLSPVTSAGVLSGTPTTVGSYGPYVFTVTDSGNATAASTSLSITINSSAATSCRALGNEGALNSSDPYAFLLKGADATGKPLAIAGSFTPNGSGGITNATVDYNGFTNGPQQLQVNVGASSYAFGTNGQGCVYLSFSGLVATPPVTSLQLSFSLAGFDGTVYRTGRVIESDYPVGNGTKASGLIHVQAPGSFALTSLQRNYAFGLDGWSAGSNGLLRTALAGSFTNASGVLSAGFADLNVNKASSGELTGASGTLNSAIDSTTGRGTGTYTIPSTTGALTFDFAFYVINGTDLILLSTDSPANIGGAPLLSGRAMFSSPTYAAGALNGYYLLASQGLETNTSGNPAGNLVEIGTLNATSSGTIPTASIYSNDAGSYATNQYPNSAYSVEAPSGRASFTGLTATPPVVYLTAAGTPDDGIAGFLVGTDTQASSGILLNQTAAAPGYTLANVSGNYAAGTSEDLDGLTGTLLGLFTFTGTGNYTAISQIIGSIPNSPNLGTIAINTDGSGSLDGGNFPLVTNGTEIFAIPDSGDPLLYIFPEGTIPH